MTDSTIVGITDRARGILAFEAELQIVERQIAEEKDRHAQAMVVLATKRQALEQSIFQLGAN